MKPDGRMQLALDWMNCVNSELLVRICDCMYAWISDCWNALSCSCVRGVGAGPVTCSPLMLVVGDSVSLEIVCLMGQMQR